MPNAAPITLVANAIDTVVSPDSVSNTHVLYQDLSEGNLSKRKKLHFDRPATEKTTLRRTVRVNVPLTRTVNGVEVMKECTARMEFIFPSDSTVSERTELRQLAASALETVAVSAVVDQPEWVW